MSLRIAEDAVMIEEGEMVVDGLGGRVRLTLRSITMHGDGPTITGEEMLCRAKAILHVVPDWYLFKLLAWEEHIPDEWCLEGLTIVFPNTSFVDSNGRRYVMCLEEDEDHPLKKWGVVLHPIVDAAGFGRGIRLLEIAPLYAAKANTESEG